jgi:hypothetical protein
MSAARPPGFSFETVAAASTSPDASMFFLQGCNTNVRQRRKLPLIGRSDLSKSVSH